MKGFTRLAARLPYRVLTRLPRSIAVPALSHRTPSRSDVVDRLTVAVDEHIQLEAYWLRFGGSSGPAVSVSFDDEELLRIDGLVGSPHMHYCQSESRARLGQRRVLLPESSDHDLIERTCFEVQHNLGFALHLHRRRSVQRHQVDPIRLASVIDDAHRHLLDCVRLNRQAEQSSQAHLWNPS